MRTFDEHLESLASLPAPVKELPRCGNCDQPTPEEDLELIEVVKPFTSYYSNVCPRCAKPIEISMHKLCGYFYIFYVDGFGKNRKEIEAIGDTREEAIADFRAKWENVMNLDLIRYVIK